MVQLITYFHALRYDSNITMFAMRYNQSKKCFITTFCASVWLFTFVFSFML